MPHRLFCFVALTVNIWNEQVESVQENQYHSGKRPNDRGREREEKKTVHMGDEVTMPTVSPATALVASIAFTL